MDDPRRILVIRRRAVGDLLVSLDVPAVLKERWPEAAVHLVVDRPLADVARGHDFVDQLQIYDARRIREADPWTRLRETRAWLRHLRGLRFDLVIDLMNTPQTALWTRWTGATVRVGRPRRGRGWAYTHPVRPDTDSRFAGEVFLDFARAAGVEAGSWRPHPVPGAASHRESAAADLRTRLPRGPRVVLNPTATWSAKAWPLKNFAELARRLHEACGAPALVAWGPGEESMRDTVVRLADGAAVPLPATDLPALGAYLEAADLVVTTCSGPKHLAVAHGTPTLTLFGSTNPVGWQPPGAIHRWLTHDVPCRPCDLRECPVPGHPCLADLSAARVAAEVEAMLGRAAEAPS